MNGKWLINRTNPEYLNFIAKSASISPVMAQILVNRGIKTVEEINDFLDPCLAKLSDPFRIAGMSEAVERIKSAIGSNQRIFIHGDYDADGISATAIVYHALKSLGADCSYFIPDRFVHGYGFNPDGVSMAKEAGARLIITVDCGITSFEAVEIARRENIDVIVTDHHEPLLAHSSKLMVHGPEPGTANHELSLPDAFAVINPKVSNQGSPVENLSGAGIALKLVQALSMTCDTEIRFHDFLDIAALGTIADVVPITGENRIIVSNGMPLINAGARPGISALMKISGVEGREVRAGLLSFSLIPRLNAAGRIGNASDAVELLTTGSPERAEKVAAWLGELNTERQRIEEEIFQEALSMLKMKDTSSAIVLASEKWHQGVIGIVASRIAELFYKPVVVLSIQEGIAKGSARSIPSFDINRAFSECSELLIGFGGHKQAAGIRLAAANLLPFEKKLCSLFDAAESIPSAPPLTIDADVTLSQVNFSLIKELRMIEPLGFGNPEPVLGSKMLEIISPRIVGKNHLKMKLRYKSHYVDTIGFDMGGRFDDLSLATTIDAVFTPAINEWNGNRYLQLVLKAFRPSL